MSKSVDFSKKSDLTYIFRKKIKTLIFSKGAVPKWDFLESPPHGNLYCIIIIEVSSDKILGQSEGSHWVVLAIF